MQRMSLKILVVFISLMAMVGGTVAFYLLNSPITLDRIIERYVIGNDPATNATLCIIRNDLNGLQQCLSKLDEKAKDQEFAGSLLMLALMNPDSEISAYLIDEGYWDCLSDKQRKNFFYFSFIEANKSCVELLLELDATILKDGDLQRMILANEKDLQWLEYLLHDMNFDINAKGEKGENCLFSIYTLSPQWIKLLIKKGADPNVIAKDGRCVLHDPALRGRTDIAQTLINAGCPLDAQTSDTVHLMEIGDTPLHLAARWGYADVVKFLLDAGADMKLRNVSGDTPADAARKKNHPDIAALIETWPAR